jgi:hypothetical protein
MTDKESERGQRAYVEKDGSVHGSGAGAGGGNPGEDYDDDPVGGGGDMKPARPAKGNHDKAPGGSA